MESRVVIPTFGCHNLLEKTLKSISKCKLPSSYEETVVIENGSRTGSDELVSALPARLNARYMHRERSGKSYALNEALDTIPEGLVVFFDDDVEVHPEALNAYVTAAREYGPGHFFGGSVRVDREHSFPEGLTSLFPASTKGYNASDRIGQERMVFLGFNWAAYTEDLKRVRGFNPLLGPGSPTGTSVGDESDLQQRMIKEGVEPIAVPQAVVRHHVPEEHTRFRWLLKRKCHVGVFLGIKRGADKRLLSFALEILISIVKCFFNLLSYGRVGKYSFLCNLAKNLGKMKGYLDFKRNFSR